MNICWKYMLPVTILDKVKAMKDLRFNILSFFNNIFDWVQNWGNLEKNADHSSFSSHKYLLFRIPLWGKPILF